MQQLQSTSSAKAAADRALEMAMADGVAPSVLARKAVAAERADARMRKAAVEFAATDGGRATYEKVIAGNAATHPEVASDARRILSAGIVRRARADAMYERWKATSKGKGAVCPTCNAPASDGHVCGATHSSQLSPPPPPTAAPPAAPVPADGVQPDGATVVSRKGRLGLGTTIQSRFNSDGGKHDYPDGRPAESEFDAQGRLSRSARYDGGALNDSSAGEPAVVVYRPDGSVDSTSRYRDDKMTDGPNGEPAGEGFYADGTLEVTELSRDRQLVSSQITCQCRVSGADSLSVGLHLRRSHGM